MQGDCSPVTPALLENAIGLKHCSSYPARAVQGGSGPTAKPVPPSRFPLLHPHVPLTSGSTGSFMQSPFHTPKHWPVVLCTEPRKHQSKAAAWRCFMTRHQQPQPVQGHGASYRCPSPGGSSRRAVFVSRAGEGKPHSQPEAKNNSRESRNSLREKAREAKRVCVRAEPAASRPATHSHRGSGLEPCPPSHPHASHPLSQATPVTVIQGPSCPLPVGLGGISREDLLSLLLAHIPLAASFVAAFGTLGQQQPPG